MGGKSERLQIQEGFDALLLVLRCSGSSARTGEKPFEAKGDCMLTISKEVLSLQGIEFGQQPQRAWKQIYFSVQIRAGLTS